MPRSSSPTLTTGYVVLNDDGDVEHEPPRRLRDQLFAAATDGDDATTERLLEQIALRGGWCGEIDADTHFEILLKAFRAATNAGREKTSFLCLRAMGGDRELQKIADRNLPSILSVMASRGLDASRPDTKTLENLLQRLPTLDWASEAPTRAGGATLDELQGEEAERAWSLFQARSCDPQVLLRSADRRREIVNGSAGAQRFSKA